MICSTIPLPPDGAWEEEASLPAFAARLCGQTVTRLKRQAGGGNNRLYRLDTHNGPLALKAYGPPPSNPRDDRLEREFTALSFLSSRGLDRVPAAVASDPTARLGLYGWIDGTPPDRDPAGRRPNDMDALVSFVLTLRNEARSPGARAIGPAAESCPHAAELLRQIHARLHRLSTVTGAPELADFLNDGFIPAVAAAERRLHALYGIAGLAVDGRLTDDLTILSPSDFGFHNALQRPDGNLVFLDFEYFGWDDPVKLLADTLWHPAYRLSAVEQDSLLEGLVGPLSLTDPALPVRLRACLPLYGLRWCTILLNEFLPERWQRRLHAGATTGWAQAKAAQLTKAYGWLAEVERMLTAPLFAPTAAFLPLHLPPLNPVG